MRHWCAQLRGAGRDLARENQPAPLWHDPLGCDSGLKLLAVTGALA
jgi:hypothetical protein